jgi:hypothetical protein
MLESLAKMELVLGNFDACRAAIQETLLRGKSVEIKIPSLSIDVEVLRMAAHQTNEIIAAPGNRALRLLSVNMPHKVGRLDLKLRLHREY